MEKEKIEHLDSGVKWMLYPSLIFLIWGMLAGVFISINGFLIPDYFSGEYLHFGRMRPLHVSSVAFLWLLSADIGLLYFIVPRLCGTPLWSEKMAVRSSFFWWLFVIFASFSLLFGTNSGWEYAEFPMWVKWIPVKPIITVIWLFVVCNLVMTIIKRRYKKMYVSLWYTLGTLLWTTVTVIIGWYSVEIVPFGMSRVNANFFYVHNLVGLIFTPMGLAAAYYFLPKFSGRPIYSHTLSLVGFWTIAFSYAWIGAHHIIHGPVSQWLQTVSIVFSLWLFVPVFSVVTNLFGTLSGAWKIYDESPQVRFIILGTLFYLLTCVQGPLQALRNINEFTSKTDWIIGHSHIALYATFTFFAMAGVYYVVPVMTKKRIWSEKMVEWHFSLNVLGSFLFIMPLWVGGFFQGLEWASWADGSSYAEFRERLSVLPFVETIAHMRPWWLMRTIGGILITFANILFVVNIFNTIVLDEEKDPEEVGGMA